MPLDLRFRLECRCKCCTLGLHQDFWSAVRPSKKVSSGGSRRTSVPSTSSTGKIAVFGPTHCMGHPEELCRKNSPENFPRNWISFRLGRGPRPSPSNWADHSFGKSGEETKQFQFKNSWFLKICYSNYYFEVLLKWISSSVIHQQLNNELVIPWSIKDPPDECFSTEYRELLWVHQF